MFVNFTIIKTIHYIEYDDDKEHDPLHFYNTVKDNTDVMTMGDVHSYRSYNRYFAQILADDTMTTVDGFMRSYLPLIHVERDNYDGLFIKSHWGNLNVVGTLPAVGPFTLYKELYVKLKKPIIYRRIPLDACIAAKQARDVLYPCDTP